MEIITNKKVCSVVETLEVDLEVVVTPSGLELDNNLNKTARSEEGVQDLVAELQAVLEVHELAASLQQACSLKTLQVEGCLAVSKIIKLIQVVVGYLVANLKDWASSLLALASKLLALARILRLKDLARAHKASLAGLELQIMQTRLETMVLSVRTSRLVTEGFLGVDSRPKALQSLHFSKLNLPPSVGNRRQLVGACLVEEAALEASLKPWAEHKIKLKSEPVELSFTVPQSCSRQLKTSTVRQTHNSRRRSSSRREMIKESA